MYIKVYYRENSVHMKDAIQTSAIFKCRYYDG
jgi:hypothetical protein